MDVPRMQRFGGHLSKHVIVNWDLKRQCQRAFEIKNIYVRFGFPHTCSRGTGSPHAWHYMALQR